MAISVDWAGTQVITIPRNDMALIQSDPFEARQLDVDAFRLELRALEASIDGGRMWPPTHQHNTEQVIAGDAYARQVIILAPYSITFEDGQYAAYLTGANNNILDVANLNQVSIRPSNSAGLITQDLSDIRASQVTIESDISTINSNIITLAADNVLLIQLIKNKKTLEKVGNDWHLKIYDDAGAVEICNKMLKDHTGDPVSDFAAGVLAQELKSSV